ncbi:hypothetical protein TNCV_1733421 [Trichonephila clavipes]|nr:hypothetical protein TNCV_1733421 [Trichonephila clavipes]
MGHNTCIVAVEEAQNSPRLSNSITLIDADVIARRNFTTHPVKKYFIPDLNCTHIISTIIARLRTRHFKWMKIYPDGHKSYNTCFDCLLSANHIFNCPSSILANLHKIDLKPTGHQLQLVDMARAALDAFGALS